MNGYVIRYATSARRDLAGLSAKLNDRIIAAIDALAANPRGRNVVKLEGTERTYRLRVGDYRVIFDIHDVERCVIILGIKHRSEAYRP